MALVLSTRTSRILTRINALSPAQALALSALLIALIGIVDNRTGLEFRVFLFYFLPVGLVAWRVGRGPGIATAVVSALVWGGANFFQADSPQPLVIWAWNLAIMGSSFLVIAVGISLLSAYVSELERLATRDNLTGLLNRRAFFHSLQEEIDRAARHRRPFGLLFVDLNRFKAINDTYGHAAGDEVLKSVGNVLRGRLRTSDACARLGGDEFVALLRETDAEGARKVAADLTAALETQETPAGRGISSSIGLAVFLKPPENAEVALRCADGLMYAAKTSGEGIAMEVHDGTIPENPDRTGRSQAVPQD